MTQLMLFDAPVQSNISSDSVKQSPQMPARPEVDASDESVQRMGNLAHLVLARYDMVARRREAQRRARVAAAS